MKHLVKEQRAFNLRYTNAIPSPCFPKPNKNQADGLLEMFAGSNAARWELSQIN